MGKMLVIAEKPSQAKEYAEVLKCSRKQGFYENDKYIITNLFGHLFTLYEPKDYNESFKEWKIENLPIIPDKFKNKLINDPGIKKQYRLIKELAERKDVDSICQAGDPAREGLLIQHEVITALNTKKPIYTLWINSLTEEEISRGFKNISPAAKYENILFSGIARSQLDWVFGMNFTRAYTIKKGGNGTLLSIGRCQTPILAIICKRDNEIKNFKPEPYFELVSLFSPGYSGKYIDEDNNTRIDKKDTAEKIKKDVEGKEGIVSDLKKETKKVPHPLLFDLTTLQRVLNKKYGYSAQEVLDLMQDLYEKHKILSYPRTDSRHITESMVKELPDVISCVNFGKFKPYAEYCLKLNRLPITKRIADDSQVSDHTAIIPTINKRIPSIYDTLNQKEKNVFDEVTLALLAAFHGEYIYEASTVISTVNKYNFVTKGVSVIELGWKKVYQEPDEDDNKEENENIPELKKGQKTISKKVNIVDKMTTPPLKYTDASLLDVMKSPGKLIDEDDLKSAIKDHGIGTPATRAAIIETLIKRKYIVREKKSLVATELGHNLINAIETEILKSPNLTAEWEQHIEQIAKGKEKKETFISQSVEFIKREINNLIKSKNAQIIQKQSQMNSKLRDVIGKCPLCGGNIVKTKFGYGCSNWREKGCKFSIPERFCEKKLAAAQIKKLISKGITDIIKGFKSKSTGKIFDAKLKLVDGKLQFVFGK